MHAGNAGTVPAIRLDDDAISRFIARHGNEILGVARAYSSSPADADDAYQSALEALITKAPTSDERELLAWLVVVTRNAAVDCQRRGKHLAPASFETIAESWGSDRKSPDEHLLADESLGREREALRQLRPEHLRCLLLKADGFKYDEISQITGLTYASVNRYLTDGRRAYREALGMIASGDRCRRLEPVLSLIADDHASASQLADARSHLEHCTWCRATLAEFRALPSRAVALLPVAADLGTEHSGVLRQILEAAQNAYASIAERTSGFAASLQTGSELTFAKKATVVVALAASLTGGGIGLQQAAEDDDRSGSREHGAQRETLVTPPTGLTQRAGERTETGEEASRPATPNEEEVQASANRDRSASSTTESDAAPAEDLFSTETQFEPPPDAAGLQNPGGGDGRVEGITP